MTDDQYTIVPLPIWFIVAATILFSCAACATQPERYLTADEDAELRARCEPHGCTVMPTPIWAEIEAILKRSGAI